MQYVYSFKSTASDCFSLQLAEVRSHKEAGRRPLAQSPMYMQKMFAAPCAEVSIVLTKAACAESMDAHHSTKLPQSSETRYKRTEKRQID